MRTHLRYRAGSVGVLAIGALVMGCGSSNQLVLGAYDTPGTSAYVCKLSAQGGSATCVADPTSDETRWKKPGTVYVPFEAPFANCDTGIQRILIENPQSGYTSILVECARPRGPAPIAAP
jgi:hypothetical protein